MTFDKQQAARVFAYSAATLFIGVIVFFVTRDLIPFVELYMAGWVFALGFFLVFLNLSFVLGRRFCSRTFQLDFFPYLLVIFLILPTLILSFATERFSGIHALLFFYGLVFIAGMVGVFLGVRSGCRKRKIFVKKTLELEESDETGDEI